MQQQYAELKMNEIQESIDETPGMVQSINDMYSFSNDTSFSDFYNFPEETSDLSVEPIGEDK